MICVLYDPFYNLIRGFPAEQLPPVPGTFRLGHAGAGQPVYREPLVRIDVVLQPHRSEIERLTNSRGSQVDYHTLTFAGGVGLPAVLAAGRCGRRLRIRSFWPR